MLLESTMHDNNSVQIWVTSIPELTVVLWITMHVGEWASHKIFPYSAKWFRALVLSLASEDQRWWSKIKQYIVLAALVQVVVLPWALPMVERAEVELYKGRVCSGVKPSVKENLNCPLQPWISHSCILDLCWGLFPTSSYLCLFLFLFK